MLKRKKDREGLTVIGHCATFEGVMKTQGSIHLDGRIDGRIDAKGDISIGPEGHVQGDVEGMTVSVAGRVDGTVIARSALKVLPTGRIKGDVFYQSLQVEAGATINGRTNLLNGASSTMAADETFVEAVESPVMREA